MRIGILTGILLFSLFEAGALVLGEAMKVLIRTDHFEFEFHPLDRVYMTPIVNRAESLYGDLTRTVALSRIDPIRVVMAHTPEAFDRWTPDGRPMPRWVAGAAYPDRDLILLRSPRQFNQSDSFGTFRHELVHLVLSDRFAPGGIPRWLQEGLAMDLSHQWHPTEDLFLGRAVLMGRLIPLTALDHAFRGEEQSVRLAYLESKSLVRFLVDSYGADGLHRVLQSLSRGDFLPSAVEKSFGLPFSDFEAQWVRYLKVRYHWIPWLTGTAMLWTFLAFGLMTVYFIRRRRNRLRMEAWAEEEKWLSPP